MRQLFHTPVLHFDDANGRPLVGGRLYSYKAGTSTPVNLFRNETGSEVHTNPIVLNMRGECVAYGVEGLLYKLVLKDRFGATIWEVDNVSASGGGSGGGGGGGGVSDSVLVATAEIIEGDDSALSQSFSFSESEKIGEDIYIQEGSVKCNAGVYHVDFSISIAINQTTPPRPWVENVSIDYGVGYAYINLDRSNMDPTASDSVDVGYDIVVDTDGTTLPVTLIGLGTNCYATMQHFNVHKVAEAEQ